MRVIAGILAMTGGVLLAGIAHAQTLSIGVAAPLSGTSALLGQQIESGARLAANINTSEITVVDDACTAEGGAAAANAFVDAKVQAVVGFLCTDAIEAALPILKDAGIPVITVGVRTESLTDRRAKTGWPVFRLGPRGDDERNATASILTRLWKDELFAVIDDGTIYGREMAETVRATAEQAALKPVFVDTFRPEMDNQIALIGRLRKAGANHVFAGGDGSDIAIMARDAVQLDAGIDFAGGEALRTAPGDIPYQAGTTMIALPEWSEVADPKARASFTAVNLIPEGYAFPAYAAVQIAHAASLSGEPLAQSLNGQDFVTAIGTIRFNEKGDLTENPYRAWRFDGQRFVLLESH